MANAGRTAADVPNRPIPESHSWLAAEGFVDQTDTFQTSRFQHVRGGLDFSPGHARGVTAGGPVRSRRRRFWRAGFHTQDQVNRLDKSTTNPSRPPWAKRILPPRPAGLRPGRPLPGRRCPGPPLRKARLAALWMGGAGKAAITERRMTCSAPARFLQRLAVMKPGKPSQCPMTG